MSKVKNVFILKTNLMISQLWMDNNSIFFNFNEHLIRLLDSTFFYEL